VSTLAFALAATIKHDGHGGVADLLSTPAETVAWLAQHHDLITQLLGRPLVAVLPPHPGRSADDWTPAAPAVSVIPSRSVDLGRSSDSGRPAEPGSSVEAAGFVEFGGGLILRAELDVVRGEIVRSSIVQGELLKIRRAVRALFARAVAPGPPSKADADRLMDAQDALRMVNRAAVRLGALQLEWPADGPPVTRWALKTEDPVALLIGAVGRSTIDFLAGPERSRLRACPAARCVKYFLQDDPRQTWCSPSCGNRERVNRAYRKRQGR
jgi:predicted RNA-binding Zn ribbon-like protein